MCARTAVEGDGAPRACAVFKPAGKVFSVLRRLTSRHDQLDNVLLNLRCHVHRKNFLSRLEKAVLWNFLRYLSRDIGGFAAD